MGSLVFCSKFNDLNFYIINETSFPVPSLFSANLRVALVTEPTHVRMKAAPRSRSATAFIRAVFSSTPGPNLIGTTFRDEDAMIPLLRVTAALEAELSETSTGALSSIPLEDDFLTDKLFQSLSCIFFFKVVLKNRIRENSFELKR